VLIFGDPIHGIQTSNPVFTQPNMKNFITLLVLLVSSASMVVSMPAEKTEAAAGVNDAANNGAKVSSLHHGHLHTRD
jgi:hypothetical protein